MYRIEVLRDKQKFSHWTTCTCTITYESYIGQNSFSRESSPLQRRTWAVLEATVRYVVSVPNKQLCFDLHVWIFCTATFASHFVPAPKPLDFNSNDYHLLTFLGVHIWSSPLSCQGRFPLSLDVPVLRNCGAASCVLPFDCYVSWLLLTLSSLWWNVKTPVATRSKPLTTAWTTPAWTENPANHASLTIGPRRTAHLP